MGCATTGRVGLGSRRPIAGWCSYYAVTMADKVWRCDYICDIYCVKGAVRPGLVIGGGGAVCSAPSHVYSVCNAVTCDDVICDNMTCNTIICNGVSCDTVTFNAITCNTIISITVTYNGSTCSTFTCNGVVLTLSQCPVS